MSEATPQLKNLIGRSFGRWTVLDAPEVGDRRRMWLCECSCGEVRRVRQDILKNGASKSCGCLAREVASSQMKTHGLSKTPEYVSWHSMINRCTNVKYSEWASYGGRGISVCERWRTFENFLDDMGERPSLKHSIERKNNNEGYSPENCRWATDSEQGLNKRNNVRVTINGDSKTVSEWARIAEVSNFMIHKRLKRGWEPSLAVMMAPRSEMNHG